MVRYRDLVSDTICSPITAPGYSGVAVIRISGEKSLEAINKLTNTPLESVESHKSYLCVLKDQLNQKIDQTLVTYFEKDKSFTGDQTIEVACHGSPLIINQIIENLLSHGCRQAEKGEFTFRAFYNGKIDLIQAESIQKLVTSRNNFGSKAFLDQLQGELSQHFQQLEDDIILSLSHLEASIDFVEQDIETDEYSQVKQYVDKALDKTNFLIKSYDTGKNLSEAFKILLLGKTNVGKSSLFNKLVKNNRAIVTDIAGTTRDMVSHQQFIGNHQVELFDSAGLRDTEDKIEIEGIKKVMDFSEKSNLILYVVDLSETMEQVEFKELSSEKIVFVFNKSDQVSEGEKLKKIEEFFKLNGLSKNKVNYLSVSALENIGMENLIHEIENFLNSTQGDEEEGMVTQARHFNHLQQLKFHLDQSLNQISNEESPDIISQELQLGLSEINALLGKEYNDEILDKIFSDFCIGK